jgi:hypothetical protein
MKNRLYFKTKFFLALLLLIGCHQLPPPFHKGTPENPDSATISFYYFLVIYPQQQRQASCSQPNAIDYSLVGPERNRPCMSNRVTKGLIFDATTNIAVASDTLTAGQSFLCKCPPGLTGQWQRGNKVEESPPPGVSIGFIQASRNDNALQFPANYKQPDNLYCIARCDEANTSDPGQYQFLKIR